MCLERARERARNARACGCVFVYVFRRPTEYTTTCYAPKPNGRHIACLFDTFFCGFPERTHPSNPPRLWVVFVLAPSNDTNSYTRHRAPSEPHIHTRIRVQRGNMRPHPRPPVLCACLDVANVAVWTNYPPTPPNCDERRVPDSYYLDVPGEQ